MRHIEWKRWFISLAHHHIQQSIHLSKSYVLSLFPDLTKNFAVNMKGINILSLLPIHTHVLGMLPENILFNGIGTNYEKM